MTNRISDEKSWEHAHEISATVRELALDDCEAEARELDRKLALDPNVSNEERAELVAECYFDACHGLDVSDAWRTFDARFPELRGF